MNKYYLLNTKEIIVQGPLTQEEFVEAKENVEIPKSITLKDLDEYEKIR